MIKRLHNLVITYKTLIANFSYLSIVEIIGLLFPLLTYPYLIRILGKEYYGEVIFAQSIIAYVIIIINFGFNVSATKSVSEHRDDINKLSEVVSSIILLKFYIFLIASIVYIFFILYFNGIIHKLLFLFSIGLCFQEVLFPTWFFQGLEKMRYITIVSFISKLVFVFFIFILIRKQGDFYLVPLINSLGGLVSSIIALIFIFRNFQIRFAYQPFNVLINYLKESLPFFYSRLSTVINERTNTIIIGIFFSFGDVAIYDLALKIVGILKIPFTLVAQVLYPNVTRTKNMVLVKKTLTLVNGLGIFIYLILCLLGYYAVILLGGRNLAGAYPLLIILGLYLPIIGNSYVLGASTLVVLGHIKAYNYSVIYGFISYIIFILFLFTFHLVTLKSLAVACIVPELYIVIYRWVYVKKYDLFKV